MKISGSFAKAVPKGKFESKKIANQAREGISK